MDEHLRPADVKRILGISTNTLFKWTHAGKLSYIRTVGGQYRYLKQGLLAPKSLSSQSCYCYCRVSTRGQLSDLQRQVDFFSSKYPNHIIIRDIGSGLNFKRKGLNTLLEQAIKGNIREIVVTHKDRLCRFGFDLLENVVRTYSHGQIVVLNQRETSPQEELVTDLLSIITVFSSRLFGLRSHSIKKELQEKLKSETTENVQGSSVSNHGGEGTTEVNDGTIQVVL